MIIRNLIPFLDNYWWILLIFGYVVVWTFILIVSKYLRCARMHSRVISLDMHVPGQPLCLVLLRENSKIGWICTSANFFSKLIFMQKMRKSGSMDLYQLTQKVFNHSMTLEMPQLAAGRPVCDWPKKWFGHISSFRGNSSVLGYGP